MKIYYNKSYCYIDPTSNITCIIITIRGGGLIIDTTPQEYSLTYKGKNIIIFAQEQKVAGLEKLFSYNGTIAIKSCRVIFTNTGPVTIGVRNRIRNNLSSKLSTKTEDMTLTTEEYSNYNKRKFSSSPAKISLQIKTKEDIMPSISLWTKNNEPYTSMVHYHLDGKYKGSFMTGATYTKESELLFRRPKTKILKPAITNPTMKRFMRNIKR